MPVEADWIRLHVGGGGPVCLLCVIETALAEELLHLLRTGIVCLSYEENNVSLSNEIKK